MRRGRRQQCGRKRAIVWAAGNRHWGNEEKNHVRPREGRSAENQHCQEREKLLPWDIKWVWIQQLLCKKK